MGWLIALLVFVFTTVPSIVYSIAYGIFLPIGLLLRLFSKSFAIRTYLWVRKVILPVFLIIAVPLILYLYVWKLLGWIFFAWMIIYFIGRRWSGISDLQRGLDEAWKEKEGIGWEVSQKELDTLVQKMKGKK